MVKKFLILALTLSLVGCEYLPGYKSKEAEEEYQQKIEELEEKVEALEKNNEEEKEEKEEKVEDVETEVEEKEEVKKEEQVVKKVEYTGANYITINKPANDETFYSEPVIFTGVVSPNTKKITVTAKFTNLEDGTGLGEGPITEDVYTLKDFKQGDTNFTYRAAVKWGNFGPGTNKYEFAAFFADGTKRTANVTVYYSPGGAEMGKPVIYLYPEENTRVKVNVKPTNGISVSDPDIGDGWEVLATPKGDIYNLKDRKKYPYLFWEGFATNFITPKEGFVVAKTDVETFFDTKLAFMGMNEKETADFKEFWLPFFTEKPYYFITFIDQKTFDTYAPLTVEPKPDTLIRIFFDYKGLDEKKEVKEQRLKRGERKGFTLIEWGGRLY